MFQAWYKTMPLAPVPEGPCSVRAQVVSQGSCGPSGQSRSGPPSLSVPEVSHCHEGEPLCPPQKLLAHEACHAGAGLPAGGKAAFEDSIWPE